MPRYGMFIHAGQKHAINNSHLGMVKSVKSPYIFMDHDEDMGDADELPWESQC